MDSRLLPQSPRRALDVIDAYISVHAGFMPDGRLLGMTDARAIIRAKYILVGDLAASKEALQKLSRANLRCCGGALQAMATRCG